ncbi:hypothetical protein [Nitrospirillum amazonense]|uniref:Flagellar motor protein MotB n=1 Tax=Nitrospirillum amazonense TaxID=28077 RepID=A0A560JE55_9PROT|nr:hypothetical protein [Nitrospirillum amazonense]TWB68789.1 hypothetical protein FBZ87_11098 [Nitrospirillum amazonense]
MRRGTRAHGDDQESYFASMSDLMAGIVFIFLIMLMALSMYNIDETPKQQDQQSEQDYQETIAKIMAERARMVEALRRDLEARHIAVEADAAKGILTLPSAQFFAPGAAALKPEGREKMAEAATLLARYLTCDGNTPGMAAGACPTTAPVEHVDAAITKVASAATVSGAPAPETVARIQALETSAALTSTQPLLYELLGRAGRPVLTVRGVAQVPPAPSAPAGGHGHHPPPATAPSAVDQMTLTFTMALPPRR